MKAQQVRDVDSADLRRQLSEMQEQMFRFRFQMGMGQSEGLKKYRELKKDRARMLTVLRERENQESAAPAAAPAAEAKKSRKK
jgi:large subunit ribosomal protein L29